MSRRRTIIRLSAVLAVVALAKGCGDGDSPTAPPPVPDPPRPTTVTVSPATDELTALGQAIQLTAEVRDQNARVMAGATVTWTSSAISVATVDALGLVTAVGNGEATVTASAGEASGSAVVTVTQSVASVVVSPSTAELTALGETVQLTAEAFDENGHAVAGAEFSWESSDVAGATVDESGLVTGVAEGVATITASAGEASGSAVVTVTQSVASVVVSPSTAELTALGETVQLTAEAFDENGHAVEGAAFSWESSDVAVATVDESGLVTGVAEGMATITASAGEVSGSAVVTVMQPVASVEVSPFAETIGLGSTLQLMAEGFDENGEVVESAQFSWESSDVAIATVDESGLVTGVAEGMATITASAGSGQGTAEITVMDLERAALIALYEATDGPNWVDAENWLTDAPLGEWYGVDTDNSGRVVRLDLDGRWDSDAREYIPHGLSGPVPPELGNLANLMRLDLGHNFLSGPVPTELGSLADLESLHLGGNDLTGPIPTELGELASLTGLWLYSNSLTGAIPAELGSLADLESLHLGGNDLTGSIPNELGELASLTWLSLSSNSLTGAIPAELGSLADLESLHLGGNDLTGSIPNELGELASLTWLSLSSNSLTGAIPAELGSLADLESLNLSYNGLTGPIPGSFLALDALERFGFERNAELCAPGTVDFVTWLEGIEDTSGPYCNESDVGVLNLLYETSGGPGWTNSSAWLETPALDEWYGVTANALGRVGALDLTGNGLVGRLPASLGHLTEMTTLRVGDNVLSGGLPLSLASLSLVEFDYAGTGLCAPADASFQAWLGDIASHEGTRDECAPPSDHEVLEALYEVTGGPDWDNTDNWLTDAPLGDWYGVYTDASGRVVELDLSRNDLTGPIPPELGNLASLEWLGLERNDLTGPIPPELGRLTSLRRLYLSDNDLTGPIPPELVNLSNLRTLQLNSNDLTGPIPPELGRLTSLGQLYLSGNDLTGPIPPELGNLASLEWLSLASNDLTGPLPPELAGISTLRELSLANNSGLSGPLPARLTDLRLETLLTGGTNLCAPSDPGFQAWLQTVHKRRVAPCGSVGTSMAYLTQAVQSREYPVPLVWGEKALLRVFVTAVHPTIAGIPKVRARFYLNGTDRHVTDIPAKTTFIPTEVLEHSLSVSANAEIPGEIVQPGLEMVIEIDPEGTLDAGLGVVKRIPATGRMAVDVREMPVFDLTVIPFLWSADPNREVVETTEAMETDPEGHELLWDTRTLLPIGDLDVTAHEPVLSSSNSKYVLLAETRAIRAMEGGSGHYMGMMSGTVSPGGGVAGRPGRVSFSEPYASTMAHELGHNLSLQHAPCGNPAQRDLSFPYPDGSTGAWGYDFRDGGGLVHPSTPDLMSYCRPRRISDYHFTNALHFRLFDERRPPLVAATSLLLWGGMDAEGEPFLNPAFVVDAPPALPDDAGEHRIAGRTASGVELFSLDFAMPETADGDGSSSFAFVLPAEPGWADNLASITFSGPGGSVALDSDTDLPMAILLDPSTGQVRGILRDMPQADAAAALAPQAGPDGLDVLFSRGIPDAAAWRR